MLETIVSMALISIIFVMVIQSFNSLLLGSYLVDARTSVRNEGEFIGEFFKLRIKNADPRTIKCDNARADKPISWQSLGSSDSYKFFLDTTATTGARFCLSIAPSTGCDQVLTYNDVIVRDVNITCELTPPDPVTGQQFTTVNLSYNMDSAVKLGDRPAVRDVSRFISVAIR